MNFRPGGSQAFMRNGWYMREDQRVEQEMIFPPDHPSFPGQPKGMKQVLVERGLWRNGLRMECKEGCDGTDNCCATVILAHQPDFMEQRSLVQEVMEAAGHMCLILPKFHFELNAIKFFWGAAKCWLRENCDYTFQTLQQNTPRALASVPLNTI